MNQIIECLFCVTTGIVDKSIDLQGIILVYIGILKCRLFSGSGIKLASYPVVLHS